MKIIKKPNCVPCPDKPPFIGSIATKYRDIWLEVRGYRDSMVGGLNYDYIERYVFRKYGENEYTIRFVELLNTFEGHELSWKDRKRKK